MQHLGAGDLVSKWLLGDQLTKSTRVRGVAPGELNLDQWENGSQGDWEKISPERPECSCIGLAKRFICFFP